MLLGHRTLFQAGTRGHRDRSRIRQRKGGEPHLPAGLHGRHAETVRITYDPAAVSLDLLLELYFKAIDPLSVDRQGEDRGNQYRTGVYYTDAEDLPAIRKVFREEQRKYQEPLAVELLPLQNFYPAEEYHQDYLDKHPDGYCHLPKALFVFAAGANN